MKIKFSHLYEKMPKDFGLSKIVCVDVVNIEDLLYEFVQRDTAIVGGGHYPLPIKGKFLVISLQSASKHNWQTIRRWTQKKELFYKEWVGKFVDCVIECEVVK